MRVIRNNRDKLRLHRRINLDLGVTVVRIPIDVFNRLLSSVDPHLGRSSKLARTVDDSGLQDSRTELGAIVESRDALEKFIRVIRHVSRTGHTVREVQSAIVVAEMLMIVPQPRHEESPLRVDDLTVC